MNFEIFWYGDSREPFAGATSIMVWRLIVMLLREETYGRWQAEGCKTGGAGSCCSSSNGLILTGKKPRGRAYSASGRCKVECLLVNTIGYLSKSCPKRLSHNNADPALLSSNLRSHYPLASVFPFVRLSIRELPQQPRDLPRLLRRALFRLHGSQRVQPPEDPGFLHRPRQRR